MIEKILYNFAFLAMHVCRFANSALMTLVGQYPAKSILPRDRLIDIACSDYRQY